MTLFPSDLRYASTSGRRAYWFQAAVWLCLLLPLYLLSRQHYLLFHGLVELFGVAVSLTIFSIGWNAYRLAKNDPLLILACAYLGVAGIDLLHTLSYKGMGILAGEGANLPTQFWIAGRYMEAFGLLFAAFWFGRSRGLPPRIFLAASLITAAAMIAAIRPLRWFPDCFLEPEGLTTFKIASEYVISVLLVAAGALFWRYRTRISPRLLPFLLGALALKVMSEMSFTLYADVYGFFNFLGHFFKIVSLVLIYRALVQGSLTYPLDTLFADLVRTRRRAEEESLRLSTVLDHLPVGVWILGEDGRILETNRAVNRIWGGNAPLAGGIEEYRDYRGWRAETGEPIRAEEWAAARAIERGETSIGEIIEIERFDGRRGTILNSAVPLRSPEGEIAGAVAVSQDITEHQKLQKEQEKLLAELDAIISASVEGVVLYGPLGEILRMNPAAEALFTYPPRETEKPFMDRWHFGKKRAVSGELFPLEKFPVLRALQGETVQAEVLAYERPDGQTVWLAVSAAPVRSSGGQMLGAVGTYTDVTRLHQLQEENENYLHMIAHDLRTPLTVIMGHSELLRPAIASAKLGDSASQSIEAVRSAGRQMAGMMEDLSDFARMRSGQIKVSPEILDMKNFLEDWLRRSSIALAISRLQVEIPDGLPPVLADSKALERAVTNLVTNALKYSSSDLPVKIEVRRESSLLVCSVQDRGPGIEPQELPQIFDRYYRVRTGGKAPGGLGLGLCIAKSLVEASGGRIGAESTPGRGSTFWFTLPVAGSGAGRGAGYGPVGEQVPGPGGQK